MKLWERFWGFVSLKLFAKNNITNMLFITLACAPRLPYHAPTQMSDHDTSSALPLWVIAALHNAERNGVTLPLDVHRLQQLHDDILGLTTECNKKQQDLLKREVDLKHREDMVAEREQRDATEQHSGSEMTCKFCDGTKVCTRP